MKILVAGANGSTGRRVVGLLADSTHDPVAMIRDEAQAPTFEEMGVPWVLADLEKPLAHAVEGMDGVIFAAGSGGHTPPEKTVDVDEMGAERITDTAEELGAERFVMLSSIRADPRSEGHRISHYYRAKGRADLHLQNSSLDYTIVRPGSLTDDEGTGRIRAAEVLDGSGSITRSDVAAVLVACLDIGHTRRKTFEILQGDVPIREALKGI